MHLIYTKTIDKSLLWDGLTIRLSLLDNILGVTGKLGIGQQLEIKLLMGGRIYEGIKLGNRSFDRGKWPNHPEMYQIRYSPNSEFSKALREIYSDAWNYIVLTKKAYKAEGKTSMVKLPESMRCQIAFFTTEQDNVWAVEPYYATDFNEMKQFISENKITENELENALLTDENARISTVQGVKRIRLLDRQVGDSLKRLYNFRCQVCGCEIGPDYDRDRHVIEAHHIIQFSQSMNNDFNNIMILCPNHHRIIHTFHGEFHERKKIISYPNGYQEPLKLNLHL